MKTVKKATTLPHPYVKHEGTPLWRAVERAIADLVENGDLTELTHRNYIVGYICKKVCRLTDKRKG